MDNINNGLVYRSIGMLMTAIWINIQDDIIIDYIIYILYHKDVYKYIIYYIYTYRQIDTIELY